MELKELDKKLEQKEAEMKRFASVDTSVLKQHYKKKVHELEQEKKSLQKEIEELRCNLSNISSTSDDGAQKLKEEYLQKLNVLESQLKKEGGRNEYEMHKLLALNQRQKMVLQRETEEASMATKRLKELLECRKASSRETFGAGNGNGPRIQALEHELEVTVLVHEVRAEYERQLEERARMAKEVARLKEEADLLRQSRLSDCLETMSPSATSSSSLVSMASLLSEAEERERGFSGRGRWNQIQSLADAINILNYLFNLASSSR
uniref:Centrosomal protein of 162 kDa n=1 Tax=Fagus sylvatica TaxID=28930 RepID=A0A2N9J462_FAGSY